MNQHKHHSSSSGELPVKSKNSEIDSAKHQHTSCYCNKVNHLTAGGTTENSEIPVSNAHRAVFRIRNMDCPTEEALIRKKLTSIAGITGLEFNLMQRVLTVYHNQVEVEDIIAALIAIDMDPEPIINHASENFSDFAPAVKWQRLIIAAGCALAAEVIHFVNGPDWLVFVSAIMAIAIGGISTYKKGWIALKNLNLNMNALMSFAVTGAILIGQWPEAAMVMVLFTLAEAIEAKAMDRARNAIKHLLSLTPERATVRQPDGSWLLVEVNSVAIGDIVRVNPGERIALDGEIILGHSAINQSAITGESLPVEKGVGEQIFAATINESGSFEYRVTALATQSTLARIINAVESAQGSKAPTQRFVDKFARIYTPTVFIIALAVGLLPPLFLNGLWLEWIYRALVLLVIACPCALVISTPVTIVSGLAVATRYGILIKGGVYLEQGRKIVTLAVDKTGTLTYGKPKQTDFVNRGNLSSDVARQMAASIASRSDHPVSMAIALAAKDAHIPLHTVHNFRAVPGQGACGEIDGSLWLLGNYRMVKELAIGDYGLEQQIIALEQQGKTVVMLIGPSGVQAIFAVADTVKETSISAINTLKQQGVNTVMLTGDNVYTAAVIAKQVGINEVKGDLLPVDKLTLVEQLAQSGVVGMVGDGINDAPALAKADIGFAMGVVGTDTAIEAADVTLIDDDLRKIPQFIYLSKATFAILVQNMSFAIGIKLLFLILTFRGEVTMWMAVFADIGTSLLVVANGLRLLRK